MLNRHAYVLAEGIGVAAQAVSGNITTHPSHVVSNRQPAPDLSAWTAAEFVIGKIPEDPPDFELCC